jgi:hypothetical protein
VRIVIPVVFAIVYALALIAPISDLGALPAIYDAYGIGDAIPWALLVLNVAAPPVFFVLALLIGRGRPPMARVLVLIVGAAASFATYFAVFSWVQAIQPPLTG